MDGLPNMPVLDDFRRLVAPLQNEVSVDSLAVDGQLPGWVKLGLSIGY